MLQLFSVLLFLILIREVLAFPKSWCRAQASNSVWNSLEKFMDYGKSSQDKSSSMKNKSCTEKELWRYLNKDLWQSKAGIIFGESIGLKPDFWLHDLKQQNLQLDRVSRQALQGRLSEVWINSAMLYGIHDESASPVARSHIIPCRPWLFGTCLMRLGLVARVGQCCFCRPSSVSLQADPWLL